MDWPLVVTIVIWAIVVWVAWANRDVPTHRR